MLFLGGLELEVEAIKKARSMGIRTIVADYYPDAPAKKYADVASMVSATDIDALAELCHNEKVDGVFTGYVDSLLPYYAQLCERVGLPCYGTEETFRIMTDKALFKQACREYSVPVIDEYTDEDVRCGKAVYPLLIKPTDSSGSRGISIVNDFSEYESARNRALSYSKSKSMLIERYMTGDEVVLYYYMQDGDPVFQGMCDRYVFKNEQNVAQIPTAYIYPSKYTHAFIGKLNERIVDMLRGLGMQNGPLFLQGFIQDDLPVLYEPGYRLCGAREHVLVNAINGIDSESMLIEFALTGHMHPKKISSISDPFFRDKYGCKLSPVLHAGTVARIEGLAEVKEMDFVADVFPNNWAGDTVTPTEVGTLRQLAYRAYIVGDSLNNLRDNINVVQESLRYYDEDGNDMMQAYFNASIL